MKKIKYLVLGAGVSGLSFANNLDDEDYLIIEKELEAGGYCRTKRIGEYVWDYAGHFFHFSHPDLKAKFESITNSNETVNRTKTTKIYYNGYYVDYPFQKNIHQLTKDEMIDCLYDLFEKVEKEKYDNFLDMLYGKFGQSITEKFLRPYNEKLYACELNYLDVDAMGRFFPYADLKDIVRNMKITNNSSYNESFLYPKKGASVFVEKLLEKIDRNNIHYGEEVKQIDIDKKQVITNQSTYKYEHLITSIPLNHFVNIANITVDNDTFSYNKVLVFNLGFDKPSIDKSIHWIYVPNKDINFYRAGFYNNIIGSDKLSMYIEIGYSKDYDITEDEIKNQLKQTLNNLKKMGIIDDHKLVEHQSIIMDPAYVHITEKSIEVVNALRSELKEKNVHMVGRYGDWKYCSIEDCMVDSIKAINSING